MENSSPFSFGKNLEKRQQQEVEMNRRMEAIRLETYNRIKNDPEVYKFLEPYNSLFHDIFLQTYASQKGFWVGMKEHYQEEQAKTELEMVETARAAIACFLKKKLMDLRREWGAGLIELPGISSPFDFMLLVDNVFAIDWISPITGEELEILLAFVEQHTGHDLSFQFPYEADNFEIPLYLEEGEDYALDHSFSAFHNQVTGGGRLMVLPDKKGLEVMAYINRFTKKEKEEKEDRIARGELPPDPEIDMKPFPPTDKAWFIESFIRRFDDRDTLQNFQTYKEYTRRYEEEEDEETGDTVAQKTEDIIRRLSHIQVQLPIEANADWRLALIESWNDYRKKSITDAIEPVYDDYLFHTQAGIAWQTNEVKPSTLKKVNDLKEKYRKGKELAGE